MHPNGGRPMPETEPITSGTEPAPPPPPPTTDPNGGRPMPEGNTGTP
jgi:hypothetical protein